MIKDQTLGRIILMGMIVDDAVGDYRGYQSSEKNVIDKADYGWELTKTGAGTVYVFYPMLKAQMLGGAARVTATFAAARIGAATMVVAPYAAGAVIGAVVGTAISQAAFGDEGAQTALGFYSLGTLPGTEAPELSTYENLLRPSETSTPGPVDLFNAGVTNAKIQLQRVYTKWKTRRTRRRRFRSWF